MAPVTTPSVVRQIGSLFDGGSVAGLTDRQLIERFNDRRDATGEAAFAALVTRHGPMVMHVCRQLLGPTTMPRTPSRPSSSSWLARLGRSATPTCWVTGSMGSRSARPSKARGRLARRHKNEVGSAMRHSAGPGVPVEPMVNRPSSGSWPASRPRFSTARSTACPDPFVCRSCSATSRA